MKYIHSTQRMANTLSGESRGRQDRYSNYQQLLNAFNEQMNQAKNMLADFQTNRSLASYSFDALDLLQYIDMSDADAGFLPSDSISVDYSSGESGSLYRATSLMEMCYGPEVDIITEQDWESIEDIIDDSLIGAGLYSITFTQKINELRTGSQFLQCGNNRLYIHVSFTDDNILLENPAVLVIEGLDEFDTTIRERVVFDRNGVYRTRLAYQSIDTVTFNELAPEAYDELANDKVTLSLFGNTEDDEPIFLPNSPQMRRYPTWDIYGTQLRLQYTAADTDAIYYSGFKAQQILQSYTLFDETSAVIPTSFTVDSKRPYIYVLEGIDAVTAKLLVFSKFDEYPPVAMLNIANEATAFSQMDLSLTSHGSSTVVVEPRYLRHRTGSKIVSYKLWYENTSGDQFAYTGEYFVPGEPYYIKYDIAGDDIYGFANTKATVSLTYGFYIFCLDVVHDDGTVEKSRRIHYAGYKQAIDSIEFTISSDITYLDLYVDRKGDINIVDSNALTKTIFRIVKPYFLYDDVDKLLYHYPLLTSLSWTGVNSFVYSKDPATDSQYQSVLCEIDEIGYLLGLTRSEDEDARTFWRRLQLGSSSEIDPTYYGHLSQYKQGLLNLGNDPNTIHRLTYTATCSVRLHVFIDGQYLKVYNGDNLVFRANRFKMTIGQIVGALESSGLLSIVADPHVSDPDLVYIEALEGIFIDPLDNFNVASNISVPRQEVFTLEHELIDPTSFTFSDPSIQMVTSLTGANGPSCVYDATYNTLTFGNIRPDSVTVSYQYCIKTFNIYTSLIQPYAIVREQSSVNLIDTPYVNSEISTAIVNSIISTEKNRWGQ